jgi:hypothetical protein
MIHLAFALSLMVAVLGSSGPAAGQSAETATIEGRVYDLYEAVIPKVAILLEDLGSHTVKELKTDDEGHYTTLVKPGRYSLSQKTIVGWPIPYEHSSFSISAGEKVIINFRPRFPFSISDSIEGGHWIERYEPGRGLVSTTVYFIEQTKPGLFIRDLRVQSVETRTRADFIEFSVAVTASFDRLSVYADKVLFYPKKGKLQAEKDVIFEDGKTVRRARKVEIDLSTGSVLVDGTPSPAAW